LVELGSEGFSAIAEDGGGWQTDLFRLAHSQCSTAVSLAGYLKLYIYALPCFKRCSQFVIFSEMYGQQCTVCIFKMQQQFQLSQQICSLLQAITCHYYFACSQYNNGDILIVW